MGTEDLEDVEARRPSSRRSIYATRLVTLILTVVAIFGCVGVVSTTIGLIRDDQPLSIQQKVRLRPLLKSEPADHVGPEQKAKLTTHIQHANRRQILMANGPRLLIAALAVAGLLLLRRVLWSVRRGDPFTSANSRRLRLIALLLLVGIPVSDWLTSLFARPLARATTAGDLGAVGGLFLNGEALVGGLVLLVLAEVFAHGVDLREDLEGTV